MTADYRKNIREKTFQSGFLPGNTCILKLLSILHDISSSFDCDSSIDVRGVFLDISKALDKVWHDGIIFKLETYGVKGKLRACYQRLVLNDSSQDELNYDLQKVGHGAFQWKMQCNPDKKKNKHKKRFFPKKLGVITLFP